LGVWVYERTESVSQFALVSLFTTLPTIAIAPLAGTLVDRWDRRWAMTLSDAGAGLSTLAVALLLLADRLEVWHIYLGVAANSAFSTIQWLAYSATVTLLVPKEHLGRAGGMRQFGESLGLIVSPALAGVLLKTIQLEGVLLIDFATFLVALTTLLAVRVPKPPKSGATSRTEDERGSLLRDAVYGWTYLTSRPGLLGLLIFFAVSNFLVGMATVLGPPFVLSLASPAVLGIITSVGGGGMLLGGMLMSVWGGPKRRIYGVLGFELLGGLSILIVGLQPSVPLFAVLGTIFFFRLPIVNGSRDAIWQSKVPPEVQGRVFAVRRVIAWSTRPLAFLIAGPLADRVFEPLMTVDGPLAKSIGRIIGVGPGHGISLLFAVIGTLAILAAVAGYLYPRLRLVEDELPDMGSIAQAAPGPV
jgi:MFS family permease